MSIYAGVALFGAALIVGGIALIYRSRSKGDDGPAHEFASEIFGVTIHTRTLGHSLLAIGLALMIAAVVNNKAPAKPDGPGGAPDPLAGVAIRPVAGHRLPSPRAGWRIHIKECAFDAIQRRTLVETILERDLAFTTITQEKPLSAPVRALPKRSSVVYYGDNAEVAQGLAWELTRRSGKDFTFEKATTPTGGFKHPDTTLVVALIGFTCQR